MLKIEQDGQEFEYWCFGIPEQWHWVLNNQSLIKFQEGMQSHPQALFKPKPKYHVFGGVVFEETGEVREPYPDEWSLDHTVDGKPIIRIAIRGYPYPDAKILRPVEVQ